MTKKGINRIKLYLIFFLITLIALSYHPLVFKISDMEQGTLLSNYILIFTLFLFILSFDIKIFFYSKFILFYFTVFFIIILESMLIYALGYDIKILDEIKEPLIPFIAIVIGWQLKVTNTQIKYMLLIFVALMFFVATSQVYTNIGGFIIEDQYLSNAKNSLGALIAIAAIIMFFLSLNNNNWIIKNIYILFVIILLIMILTIRARTAFVVSIFIIVLSTLSQIIIQKKGVYFVRILIFTFAFLLIYLLFNDELYLKIQHYILESFTSGVQGDDFFSGRLERNQKAMEIITNSPLFGNLTYRANIEWVHNYLLLKISNYGIIGGFLWALLYIYILTSLIKSCFKKNIFDLKNIGVWLLMISFGVSMAEPTFPYGPGTVNFIPFFLIGVSIKYNYDLKYSFSTNK